MDNQQNDPQSKNGAGIDFMKMLLLTVVCIIGAVVLVKLLQAVM